MSQPTWIGRTLGGRYTIETLLGQGGMSAVYKGADPNLRRTVAIKLIHPHLSSDPEFVRRFEQEAAAVAQLRHPNIIQVYDFNHDGEVYFMILEYVPGETLQARLKALDAAGQRLPLAETLRIMAGVSEAVAYAHQRGMIHRDLKPGNVMLDPQSQPILMDFGVAKIVGGQHHTATGAIVGTVAYMSPEQARGEHIDERSDLYSLGIMLYEMTTGRPPFEGDSAMTVMLKHLNEPVPDVRQIVAGVPEELAALIEKALAKDPADRLQTAAELAAGLRAIAASARPTQVGATPAKSTAPTAVTPPAPTVISAPTITAEAAPTPGATDQAGTRVAVPAKKTGAPVGVFIGAGALVVAAIVVGVLMFPRSGPPAQPTRTLAAIVEPSAMPEPTQAPATPTQVPPSQTSVPPTHTSAPTHTPLPPTDTPAPANTPTETPIPIPEGMVLIPAGTFQMGSERGQADERPVHPVTLKAFFMDKFEVTNARYKQCADAGQCSPPATKQSFTRTTYFGDPEFDNYPVIQVAWDQAAAFCAWESKRLPTEAEWEYAASGGDGRRYPWGDAFDPNRLPAQEGDTTEAGKYPDGASPFGVFDLAGNVLEWVNDRYGAAYYAVSPAEDPAGPDAGPQRVMRGGSFGNTDGRFYTTTRRYHQPPGVHDADFGFRCALDAP